MRNNKIMAGQCTATPQRMGRSASHTPFARVQTQPAKNQPNEQQLIAKYQETMNDLLDLNGNYLADKVKISSTPKPSKYYHKLPGRTKQSEYNRQYTTLNGTQPVIATQQVKETHPKKAQYLSAHNIQKAMNSVMPSGGSINGYATSYKQSFPVRKDPAEAVRRNKSVYIKDEAPTFNETSYKSSYPDWGYNHNDSCKRNGYLGTYGKIKTETSYQHSFPSKQVEQAKPIHQKDNKIFVTIDASPELKESQYKHDFSAKKSKNKNPVVFKPNKTQILNNRRIKYKTEYSNQFIEKTNQKDQEHSSLTMDELRKFILNNL